MASVSTNLSVEQVANRNIQCNISNTSLIYIHNPTSKLGLWKVCESRPNVVIRSNEDKAAARLIFFQSSNLCGADITNFIIGGVYIITLTYANKYP